MTYIIWSDISYLLDKMAPNISKCSQSSEKSPKILYYPIVNGLQKIALYEARTKFYLIGSNASQTNFRVLKIDRTEFDKLIIVDDGLVYNHADIRRVLSGLSTGNTKSSSHGVKFTRSLSAFGLVGFVRFLHGYYLILVTKRRKIASVGMHSIYKVEDTSIRYIPHEQYIPYLSKAEIEKEQKYLKLFLNVDLKAHFYFSYSYDLTHTLQHNLEPPSNSFTLINSEKLKAFLPDGRYDLPKSTANEKHYAYLPKHDQRYLWNSYLYSACPNLHPSWKLFITHGYIEEININVYGHSYFLTLIARRSSLFAGTRFLKRGINFNGDVANEVETEQIVFDSAEADLPEGKFTSFVQIRGSVPAFWCQDTTKIVPKPPISFYLSDPTFQAAGKHFNRLLKRHGSPILTLDLTKCKDTRMHESSLGPHFKEIIEHLNLTFPPAFKLDYRKLDMANLNKLPHDNAMNHLSRFAEWSLQKNGIFSSQGVQCARGATASDVRYQTGVVRVNCVDCLDRTNTAEFALGKCALGYQLHALGVLSHPNILWDTDCSRELETVYEDHGDSIALQYGGSQLVHRIKTYRNQKDWSTTGSDMMQSLSRYYSNTFSDLEKQQSMNLFLGVFIPYREKVHLWDLPSDYALHNPIARGITPCSRTSNSSWWTRSLLNTLPLPLDIRTKRAVFVAPIRDVSWTCVDLFTDFNKPDEMTPMTDHFHTHIDSTSKRSGNMSLSPLYGQYNTETRRPSVVTSVTFSQIMAQSIAGQRRDADSRRGSISNSSSDAESNSISLDEQAGIMPPLDHPSGNIVSNVVITGADLKRICQLPDLPTLLIVNGTNFDQSEFENIITELIAYDRDHDARFKEIRDRYLQQLITLSSTDSKVRPLTSYEKFALAVQELFENPKKIYGDFCREPTSDQIQIYARHTRMAYQSSGTMSAAAPSPLSTSQSPPNSSQSPLDNNEMEREEADPRDELPTLESVLNAAPPVKKSSEPLKLVEDSTFKHNSYLETDEPAVDSSSRQIYNSHVQKNANGPSLPSNRDLETYRRYASFQFYNPRKDPALLICN